MNEMDPSKDEFRVDKVFSAHTINSSRMLLVISASVALSKALDVEISQMQILSEINATERTIDVAYLIVLTYLVFAHAVNWMNDRAAAPGIFDFSNAFGDHQDSYGAGELTGYGWIGFLVNLRLLVKGQFGFDFWTPLLLLIWVKHLIVPIAVYVAAMAFTIWSVLIVERGVHLIAI